MHVTRLLCVILMLGLSGCESSIANMDPDEHGVMVSEWRSERLARLKAAGGYLNLAGLYWLKPGEYSFGSSPDNDLLFPEKAAGKVGIFEVDENGVVMTPEAGVDVRYEEIPVRSLLLSDDTTDNPITVTHGSLAWVVIKRSGRFAIRLRDFENPALMNFPPLDYFPVSTDYRVEATLQFYKQPRITHLGTVIEGLGEERESPGVVRFELDEIVYELEAYRSNCGEGETRVKCLFFVFGDQTNNGQTYPAGRFLYAKWPDEKGRTVLDFNRSYSPPCAFNDFTTCPVATPRNRLKGMIAAGEKYDAAVHSTPMSVH